MKKLALMLLMIFCITGMAVGVAEESLPVFADLTGIGDFLANIDDDNPIVSVYFTHGYGFSEAEFSSADASRISCVVSALQNLEITGTVQMDVTDWYPLLMLHAANGTRIVVRFNGEWLEVGTTHYELSGIKEFNNEMNLLINETAESRRTLFLDGEPVDLMSITLRGFYDAGFDADICHDSNEAVITHPNFNGKLAVGITDDDPDSPLTYVRFSTEDELPVVWCGGSMNSGLEYWENELDGFLYDMPANTDGDDSYLGWRCADLYLGNGPWIRFMSDGDTTELHIISK